MTRLIFVFVMGILSFATIIYIFDQTYDAPVGNNDGHQDGDLIYKEWRLAPRLFEDRHWLDAVINGYLLAIGDYVEVNYADHFDTGTTDYYRAIYYTIFIVATIFS